MHLSVCALSSLYFLGAIYFDSCSVHPCLPILYPCLFLAIEICLHSCASPAHACCIIVGYESWLCCFYRLLLLALVI